MGSFDPYADLTGGAVAPTQAGNPYADLVAGNRERPRTLADKFRDAYQSVEQAPAIAANYYSPGGADVLSEGLTPQPPSISQLVESGATTPDDPASDTYGGAVWRKLAGVGLELGASPTNEALALGTAGLGNYGAAGRLGQRAISLGFAGSMIPGAAEKLAQAEAQREQEGLTPRVAGQFAGAGLEAGFAGLAGAHGVSPFEAPRTLREKFAEQAVAPDLVPDQGTSVPNPGTRPIIQRPAFLGQVDRQAPPIPPGPELGYGRGGIPVEAPPIGVQPEAPPAPPVQAAPVDASLGEAVANVAPQVQAAPPEAIPERRTGGRDDVEAILSGLPPEQADVLRNHLRGLETQTQTDSLTGLKNKAGWEGVLATARPEDTVVVADLEKFKPVNDQYGHLVGDDALRAAANVLKRHFGEDAARFGGDEFGGVLRNIAPEDARALAEKANADLAAIRLQVRNPQTGETLEIQPLRAHIGFGRKFEEADAAANAVAAESRKGGRGDVELPAAHPDQSGSVAGTAPLPEARLQGGQEQLAQFGGAPSSPEASAPPRRAPGEIAPQPDSRVPQPPPHRLLPDTQLLGDRSDAEAVRVHGFDAIDRDRQSVVLSQMARLIGNDHQVFRSVVESVPVSVMHDLASSEFPTEDLLHDPTVLAHRLSAASDAPVSPAVARFVEAVASHPEGVVTGSVAERASLPATDAVGRLVPPNGGAALGTNGLDNGHPSSVFSPEKTQVSAAPRPINVGDEQIKRAFPMANVSQADGGWDVALPNGGKVRVRVDTHGIEYNADAFQSGRARPKQAGEQIVGSWQRLGTDGIIRLAKAANEGTVHHEAFHAAMDLALSQEQRARVLERYGNEEAAAEAYSKWNPAQPHTMFGRIASFFQRIYRAFKPNWESTFEDVRSGNAYRRPVRPIPPEGVPRYATALAPEAEVAPPTKSSRLPLNLDHMDLPAELKSKWADDLSKNKDYYASLKGHVTGAEVQQAARDMGLSREEIGSLLKGKRNLTKEEFFAARDLLVEERRGLGEAEKDLSRAETGGADTRLAKSALAKRAVAFDALLNNFMGKQAEAARTLAFFRLMAHGDLTLKFDAEGAAVRAAVEAITKRTGSISDEIADKIRDAIKSGDAARITATIHEALRVPLKDKIFEAWINGLLSSPSTSVTKGVSDIANLLVKGGERGIASQIDALNERWTGSPRQRFAGEMSAHFGGMKDAIPDALQSFKDAWAERPVGVLGEGDVVEHALRGPAIPGKLGKIVRAGYGGGGSRALRAIDAFSKTLARSSEKHVQALRIAHEESGPGASVGDISRRASEIASTPDDQLTKLLGKEKGQAVLDAMSKFQKNATFTDDFGPAMLAVQQLRKDVPLARYVIPFTKVPWNIARNVYQHTPLNFLNILHKIKSGELKGAAITDELVKPLVGTPLMIAVALKAANGEITGNGPDDTQKRAAWLAAGFQPYSIKIPGGWVSYKKIEPWAGVMGLAADVVEASKEQDSKDKIAHAVAGLQEAFEKKSFLTGLEQIGGLLKDPIQYTKSYAQQMEGTVVPAVFSRAAQAIDPTLRQVNGPGLDPLLSRIPFASEKLQPKLGPAGEELQRGGTAVERFASPFTRTEEKQGPVGDVERVLAEVGYSPGKPPQKLALHGQHVDLTPEEQAVYGKADALAAQRIAAIVKSSAFTALPDTEQEGGEQSKEAVLRRIYTKARAQARDRIISTSDFGQRFRTAAQQSRQPHA